MSSPSEAGAAATVPKIPDYVFSEDALIGEGTYGQVWYGLFKEDQPRAVKIFKPETLRGDRWREEYEKLKALDEPPGIVTLYDRGETEDGLPFVAMRPMADLQRDGGWQGRTLKQRIEADDLDIETRWRLIFEIAETLAYMHRQGVYHCDVKPSNVLLSSGEEPRPVLCDFGQSIGEGFSPDGVTGTFLFASPEQLRRNDSVIESWDVYSFGVTAFQLLTGRLPRLNRIAEDLKSEDAMTVLERTVASLPTESLSFGASLDRELIPLVMVEAIEAERKLDVPPEFRGTVRDEEFEVVLNCLALDRDRPARFAGMPEVVEAFEQVSQNRAIAVERRKKIIYATLMVFGLMAAAIAGWQWFRAEESRQQAEAFGTQAAESAKEQERLAGIASTQRDEAQQQKLKAEEQSKIADSEKENALESEKVALLARSTAESLINSMMYDLKDRLEPLGRLDLLDQVSADAERYFANLPESQRNSASERERSTMLNGRGEVFMALGNYDRALELFGEAREIRSQLQLDAPDDLQRKRDLSVTLERIGDALSAESQLDEAEKSYRESLQIRENLAGDAGEEGQNVRDIGVARSKLSDVLARKGDFAGASRLADLSLEALRRISTSPGSDPGALRDLSAALLRSGDLHRQNGKQEEALACFQESADLLEELLKNAEPDDTVIRRDYSAALFRLGEWNADAEKVDEALLNYGKAVPIVRRLAASDPANPDRQRNLALLLSRIGEIQAAAGKSDEANASFGECVALFDSLIDRSEPQQIWLEDAQAALIGWGDLDASQNRWSDAREKYARSLILARRSAESAAVGSESKTNLVVSLFKTALAIREKNEPAEFEKARGHFEEALSLLGETKGDQKKWEEVIRAELEKISGE